MSAHLLGPDEPESFFVRNPDSVKPLLLVCDHASRRIPQSLGDMGLDPVARRCHLAWDIGAGALTKQVASDLDATAVMCRYSRLVVDCNRELMDPGAFLEFGDGVVIAGNRRLRSEDKSRRSEAIYWPYHRAIEAQIERFSAMRIKPVFAAIHSFAPVVDGHTRPWEIGVLWDRDRVTAQCLIDDFRQAGFVVGDNEPYSGKAPQDYTIDHHAEARSLAHVGIEIRQDLISHDDGVARIAAIMSKILGSLPERLKPMTVGSSKPEQVA